MQNGGARGWKDKEEQTRARGQHPHPHITRIFKRVLQYVRKTKRKIRRVLTGRNSIANRYCALNMCLAIF